jgi:hypothetical protein
MLRKMSLFIPNSQWGDLREFLEIPLEQLQVLSNELLVAKPQQDIEDLAEIAAEKSGVSPETALTVVNVAMSLNGYLRASEKSSQETVDEAGSFLSNSKFQNWEGKYASEWEKKKEILVGLISSSHAIETMTKTRDILYDFQSIYLDVSVLTDIRQVFNKDATQIEGGLILHTISLDYIENRESKQIHITMSSADIENFISKLQRALKKSEVSTAMLDKVGIQDLTPRRNI